MDDDKLYEAHDAEGGGGEQAGLGKGGSGPSATTDTDGGGVASEVGVGHGENINRFRNRVMMPAESASDLEEKVSTKSYSLKWTLTSLPGSSGERHYITGALT